MGRQCSRSGCAEAAAATLTYQYRLAQVWLDDLAPERDPHAYDLCRRHTARLSAPVGWMVEDRRGVRPLIGSTCATSPSTSSSLSAPTAPVGASERLAG